MPTIEQLEKLLALDPSDPFVHYGLGQEHANAGDHTKAIACYDQTLALDPVYCYAYFFKAQSLQELGHPDQAIECVKLGITKARESNDMHAASELAGLLDEIE
tara:strand:- start:99 stop:407 length:309 start_codon:yes stop_codon:yes gene_type:complete